MAQYVFWTGDEEGVAKAVEEFIRKGLVCTHISTGSTKFNTFPIKHIVDLWDQMMFMNNENSVTK